MNGTAVVLLSGVTHTFRDRRVTALDEVNLRVDAGDYLAITGPSGCGKSTLLHVLCGIEEPTAGEVRLDGEIVRGRREWIEARARRIGVVFQSFNLLPTLTAAENVEVAMFGVTDGRRERERRALELLDRVGLGHRANHRPSELSGGQQQRVAIARSLANRPRLLLADEPTGNLDSRSAAGILEVLEASREQDRLALVIATHDPFVARRAERLVTMCDGRLTDDGAQAG